MTFGELLKLVFDAHYEDLASNSKSSKPSRNTYYTHEKLQSVFTVLPWKWKKEIIYQFNIITQQLREHILKCPHEKVKKIGSTFEECERCGATRKLEDIYPDDMWNGKQWGAWDVY